MDNQNIIQSSNQLNNHYRCKIEHVKVINVDNELQYQHANEDDFFSDGINSVDDITDDISSIDVNNDDNEDYLLSDSINSADDINDNDNVNDNDNADVIGDIANDINSADDN